MEDDQENIEDNEHVVPNDADTIVNKQANLMNNGGICNAGALTGTLEATECGIGTEIVKWCVSGHGGQNLPSSSLPASIRVCLRKLPETEMEANQQDLIAESNPEAEHLSVSTSVGDMLMKAERKRRAESLFDCETKNKTMKIELATENVGQRCKKSAATALERKRTEKAIDFIKKLGIKKVMSLMKDKTNIKELKGSTIKTTGNGKDKVLKKHTTRTKILDGDAKPGSEVIKRADEAETGVKKQPAKTKKVVKKCTTEDDRLKKRPVEAKNVVRKRKTSDKALMVKPETAKTIVKTNTVDAEKAQRKKPEKVVTKEANGVEKASKKRPENAETLYKEANGVEKASKKRPENAETLYEKSIIEADKGVKKNPARVENVFKRGAKSESAHKGKPSQAKRIVKKSTMDAGIALKKKPEKVVTNEVEKSSRKRPEKAEKVVDVMVTEAEKEVKKKLATTNEEDMGKATEGETGANKHPAKTETPVKKKVSEASERLVKKKILQAENFRKKACKAAKEVKEREIAENVGETQVAKVKRVVKKKAAKTDKVVGSKATEAETVENEASAEMENVVKKKSTKTEKVPEAKKKALKNEKVVEKKAVEGDTGVKAKEGKAKNVVKKKATVTFSGSRENEAEEYTLIERKETENVKGVKRKATEMEKVTDKKTKRTDIEFKRSFPKDLKEVKKTNVTVVRQKKCRTLELRLTAVKKIGPESAAEVGTLFKQNQQAHTKTSTNVIEKNQTEMEVGKNSKVSLHPVEDALNSGYMPLDSSSLPRDDCKKNCAQTQEIDPVPVLSEVKSVALERSVYERQDVSKNADKLKVKVLDCTVLRQKKIDPSALVLVKEAQETLISEPSVTKTRIHVEDRAIDESLKNLKRDMQGRLVVGTILLPTDKSRSIWKFGKSLSGEFQVIDCGSVVPEANSQLNDSQIAAEEPEIDTEMNPESRKHLSHKEVCASVQQKTEPYYESKTLFLNEAVECVEEAHKPDTMSNLVGHSLEDQQIKKGDINNDVIPAGETALSAENPSTCPITMEPLFQNAKDSVGLATSVDAGSSFTVPQHACQPKKVLQPEKHTRLDDIAGKLWKMKLGAAEHADHMKEAGVISGIQNQYDAVASELNTVVDKSMRDASVLSEHSYARKQSTDGEATIPNHEYSEMMQAADILPKPVGTSNKCTISHSVSLTSEEHFNADVDSNTCATLAEDSLNPFTTPIESISSLPEEHLNAVIPSHDVKTVREEHANAVVSSQNVTAIPEMQFNATKHTQSFAGPSVKHLLAVTDSHGSKAMSEEQLNADIQTVTSTTEKQRKLITPVKSITAMSEKQLNVISCSKNITDLQEKQLKAVTHSKNIKAVSGKKLNAVSSSQSVTVVPECLNAVAHSQSVTTMSEEELNVNAHSHSITAMPKLQLQAVAPTQSVVTMPKEYLYDLPQPTRLFLVPDENYIMGQQACYSLVPDVGVSANLDVYDVAQHQGSTMTTPVDYCATFAPHPGFPMVLQGDNYNSLQKEMCCNVAQLQAGNMLQLQNDTLWPGYAVVESQVGNTKMLQLQNDTPDEMCYNVLQVKNNNLLQLQNDTCLLHKMGYEVAPSQVANFLPLQNDTFLPEHSRDKVSYFVESSEDKREMAEDENVNHLQSQSDAFLSREVCYIVESSEDEREMAEDENVNENVNHLQSQNDAFLSEDVCYIVESSEDEREMANENVDLLLLQNDAFLSEEVCCITSEFNDDLLVSQDNCYTLMPTHKTEVSSIKFGISTQLQTHAIMSEKDSFCIVGQSEDVVKASEGHFEQLQSDEHILNWGKDIILESQDLTEGYVSDPCAGNTHFSGVKDVDVLGMTMPQNTINLPEVTSFAPVEREKDESAVVPNFVDVQRVNCSTVLPSEDGLDIPSIGYCVEVQSASIEIMPECVTDDGAVTLKKEGFVGESSHNPEQPKRKLPKRQCKSLATAKENSKDAAQKLHRRSTLGLRITPTKVKPFQFDHKGVAVMTEEKPCETSKESGDIVSKLLQSLVKSNKKTTNPKKHLVRQQKSDLAESSGSKPSPPVSLPLGELVWARLSFQRFWPAIVVDPLSCGQSSTKPGCCWVFWFGDYKVSEVPLAKVLPFASNFSTKYVKSERKTYETGILEAVKEVADRVDATDGGVVKSSKDLMAWASSSFSTTSEVHKECPLRLPSWILEKLEKIRLTQLQLQDSDTEAEVCRKDKSNAIKATSEFCKDGREIQSITDICIVCHCVLTGWDRYEHPFFNGGLCPSCRETILQSIFFFDSDGTNSYCIICGFGKEVFVCEVVGCNKVYCTDCIRRLAGESVVEAVRKTDTWSCFLCTTYDPKKHGLLNGKQEWRTNLASLFHDSGIDTFPNKAVADRQPIRVLSLFDGIGTGKLVLDQLNIQIGKYLASEVEQDAITVAQIRHPGLIHHLGDVRNVKSRTLKELGPIDLLIGGSPCNELSVANPSRKGLEAGSGLLFFEFHRILSILKIQNTDRPLFWIYENVASMNDESRSIISRMFECEPALWDAQYFSAQRRARYFWGNIPGMYCPLQYSASEAGGSLEDSLFPTRKAKVQKVRTITTQRNSLLMDRNKDDSFPVTMGDADDSLWIPEVERIFGFPEHYTDVANLSASRRLKLLGQSWSVPVIRHLLSPLCNYFQVTSNAAETLSSATVANNSGANVTTVSVSNAATSSSTNAASDSN